MHVVVKHLWRNRLARSAVNRKVGGSSPPRCGFLISFFTFQNHFSFNLACSFIYLMLVQCAFVIFCISYFYNDISSQVTHCGRVIELIPGGSRVPVTPDRVHEYVQ